MIRQVSLDNFVFIKGLALKPLPSKLCMTASASVLTRDKLAEPCRLTLGDHQGYLKRLLCKYKIKLETAFA